jgi:hypothetical protein
MMTLAKLDRRSTNCARGRKSQSIHVAEPLIEEHEIESALADGLVTDVDVADSSVVGVLRLHERSLA